MTSRLGRSLCGLIMLAALLLAGCGGSDFSEAERKTIASLALSALPTLPPDPTNRFADEPGAAALGATLFFDQRMSRDGNVACSTCHKIDRQFQDDLPRAVGVGETNRRTMPLAGVARNAWFFWDGRRDSLWAQALGPLENPLEHAGTRTFYALKIATTMRARYEAVFGPLPNFSGLPASAGPLGTPAEQTAWAAMSQTQRDDVNSVFANMGKALAAFERSIVPEETRFDRFAAALARGEEGDATARLSDQEIAGLKLFIGKARCSTCHNGPLLTDGAFHNTGVAPVAGLPADQGRATAVAEVEADPFNCFGKFRDGDESACAELRFMVRDGPTLMRAYKTPSLRGAAGRAPYMHAGQIATLEAVIGHYAAAPQAIEGISELHPVTLSAEERAALVAFLETLSD
jgi:cytochrome c peroxidase